MDELHHSVFPAKLVKFDNRGLHAKAGTSVANIDPICLSIRRSPDNSESEVNQTVKLQDAINF